MSSKQSDLFSNHRLKARIIQWPRVVRARAAAPMPGVLDMYQVRDWMRTPVFTVNPELRIERAWELMARMGVRHLPVVKNEVLVGIVTERDLKRAVFSQNRAERVSYRESFRATFAPGDVAVEAIMTRSVSVAKPSEPLRLVAVRMLRQRVGALPVVAGNGELLGILTLSDLVRAMLTAYEEQPAATAPTITPSTTPLSQKGASVWVTQ